MTGRIKDTGKVCKNRLKGLRPGRRFLTLFDDDQFVIPASKSDLGGML
mgnify:FL=1